MVLVGKVNKDIVLRLNRHGQPAVGLCGDDGLLFRVSRAGRRPAARTSASSGKIERVDVDVLNHIAQDYIPVDRVDRRRPRGQLLQRQRRRGGRRRRARARRLQGHVPHRRRRAGCATRPTRDVGHQRGRRRRGRGGARRRSPAACARSSQACLDAIHGGVTLRAHRRRPRAALAAARAVHRRRHRHQDQAGGMSPRRAAGARARPPGPRLRAPCRVEFVRGEGARLWDAEGNEYLDFQTGLGRQQRRPLPSARSSRRSASRPARLIHVGNLFYTEPGLRLAERLAESLAGRQGATSPTRAPRPSRRR